MSASWIQDRRRKQAAGYKDDVNASLSDVMGGLEASLSLPEKERKRKIAEQTAADELGVKKSTAEASLLRAKTADEAAKESLIRKKTADDAKTNESDSKKSESVLRSRIMAGDQYKSDVPAIDDPALGGLDDTSLESVTREATAAKSAKETKDSEEKRKADAKIAADVALADARTADAEKKRRAPTGGKGAKAVDPEIAAAKKRSVLAQAKKDEADAKKAERDAAGDGKPVKPLLTPGEVTGVLELQGGVDILNRLKVKKETGGPGGTPIDTGPIAALASWFKTKAGVESPEKTAFKALAGEQIAQYIKNISGATVAVEERAELLKNVPGAGDNDGLFLAKLQTVKDTLEAKLRLQKRAFEATGRDTKIFDVPDDVGAVPPAKKPADMSDADIEARLKELKAKR